MLNLRPSKYDGTVPVEFETGNEVTPLVILGAINSYYAGRVDKMENLVMVEGFEEHPAGSLTPLMEVDFHVELPHIPMVKKEQLPVVPNISPAQRFGLDC